jgi:hypothetical protein
MMFLSFYVIHKRLTDIKLVPIKLRIFRFNVRVQNGDLVYPFKVFGSFIHLDRTKYKAIA